MEDRGDDEKVKGEQKKKGRVEGGREGRREDGGRVGTE